jgi:hypothetical protein
LRQLPYLLASLLLMALSTPILAIPLCDGVCDGPDDCPDDCAYCGDGICSSGESWCTSDCPSSCVVDTCATCSRPDATVNDDLDGIPDRLEYDLAHAFFPAMMLKDVESDLQQSYLYQGKAIPFMVQALSPTGICNEFDKCLEIRYGLAYFKDYGDSFFSGHLGDSEFYAVVVMRTQSWDVAQSSAGYWQMVRDFTAAHWGTPADTSVYGAYSTCAPNCAAWSYSQYECSQRPLCTWVPGWCFGGTGANEESCANLRDGNSCSAAGGSCFWSAPYCAPRTTCYSSYPSASYVTLYASEKKHALYHTDAECDRGGFEGADECPNTNLYSLRAFKDGRLQNVGNGFILTPDTYIQHPNKCALYDVWGNQPFGSSESTPYRQHFLASLNWSLIP